MEKSIRVFWEDAVIYAKPADMKGGDPQTYFYDVSKKVYRKESHPRKPTFLFIPRGMIREEWKELREFLRGIAFHMNEVDDLAKA